MTKASFHDILFVLRTSFLTKFSRSRFSRHDIFGRIDSPPLRDAVFTSYILHTNSAFVGILKFCKSVALFITKLVWPQYFENLANVEPVCNILGS